jgi:EAL domain-containing protein (putative c-di-GMP-specific phosphodiesterase class I)
VDVSELTRDVNATTVAGPEAASSVGVVKVWVLESLDGGRELRRTFLHTLPFRIGRLPGLELVLPSQVVSKRHAEIYEDARGLRLRDLGSTNGTLVNRLHVSDVALSEGDVLHIADFEFRLGRHAVCAEATLHGRPHDVRTDAYGVQPLSHRFVEGTRQMKELLQDGLVGVELQPIVRLPGRDVAAYEVLGRGRHPELPQGPVELFRIAADIGAQAHLSRLFRRKAVELLRSRPDLPPLFLNTHPVELEQPGLLDSLKQMRALAPQLDLTLEIHETTLALPEFIGWLRQELAEINVGLAYDDFGTGQARLLELAEVPPHYLKFDRRFVSGIDQAPPARRRLLASLVAAARELRVKTVAEGVETEAEAEVCENVGFNFGQGYLFGRPVPIDRL